MILSHLFSSRNLHLTWAYTNVQKITQKDTWDAHYHRIFTNGASAAVWHTPKEWQFAVHIYFMTLVCVCVGAAACRLLSIKTVLHWFREKRYSESEYKQQEMESQIERISFFSLINKDIKEFVSEAHTGSAMTNCHAARLLSVKETFGRCGATIKFCQIHNRGFLTYSNYYLNCQPLDYLLKHTRREMRRTDARRLSASLPYLYSAVVHQQTDTSTIKLRGKLCRPKSVSVA
jgi:hypothetical protein